MTKPQDNPGGRGTSMGHGCGWARKKDVVPGVARNEKKNVGDNPAKEVRVRDLQGTQTVGKVNGEKRKHGKSCGDKD